MTKEQEALKLALEALEFGGWLGSETAIDAIKEALAQPAQEPVAHVIVAGDLVSVTTGSAGLKSLFDLGHGAPLYATPQQRPWVGLTRDEALTIGRQLGLKCRLGGNANIDFDYADSIEAKLKEKNT